MDFNNGGMPNRDRVSERDRLELGADGKTRNEASQGNVGGAGKSFSGGGGGSGKPSKLKWILLIGSICGLIYLGTLGNGGFMNTLRSFNSTPTENIAATMTAIQKVQHDNNTVGQEQDPLYDVNNIFTDEYIQNQVEKEYAVLVYTGDEAVDEPFRDWVLANEKSIPIYRVNASAVSVNLEVLDYLEPGVPMVLIYNEKAQDIKLLDAVIKDKDLLKNIVPHIKDLQKEKKEQQNTDK